MSYRQDQENTPARIAEIERRLRAVEQPGAIPPDPGWVLREIHGSLYYLYTPTNVLGPVVGLTASASSSAGGGTTIISGGSGGAAGTNTFGMSNLGNTSGTSGVISGTDIAMFLAGGNNVTLSQSINGSSATITISVGSVAAGSFQAGVSTGGNTAGTTGTVNNQLLLVGGSNITLSQSTNAGGATVSVIGPNAPAQSVQTQNLHDVTLAGNTAGVLALISSGTMTLAGGNNVTLSQAGNAVTISGASQSVQTQGRMNVTLGGNSTSAGAGFVLISSGTMSLIGGDNVTLSQNGNAVTFTAAGTPRSYATDVGDGVATSFVVTHNLDSRDVHVMVRNNAAPYEFVQPTIELTSTNTATITFAVAPGVNEFRVIVFRINQDAYVANIGDGVATTFNVVHGLGTRDIHIMIRRNSAPYEFVQPTIEASTTNDVDVTFAVPPGVDEFRVIVLAIVP